MLSQVERLALHLSIEAYSFKARLSMAVPDAKVHFRLSTGTVTVPHITAAGGDVQLLVAAEHWLHVVSGGLPIQLGCRRPGVLPARARCGNVSDGEVGCRRVGQDHQIIWRRLSERRQKSFKNAWTKACHGLSLGTKVAAIACWVAWGRRCARLRPAQWLWGVAHMMALPPHTGAELQPQSSVLRRDHVRDAVDGGRSAARCGGISCGGPPWLHTGW